jgi:hypothetical protein
VAVSASTAALTPLASAKRRRERWSVEMRDIIPLPWNSVLVVGRSSGGLAKATHRKVMTRYNP